jgi:hypothetical protein
MKNLHKILNGQDIPNGSESNFLTILWYPGPWDGDILAQGLIELIEYPYQQGVSSFS